MGRPSLYTPELADEICDRLANGRSLNSICKDDDIPTMACVLSWLAKAEAGDDQFTGLVDKYLRAREVQADTIFDECLDIADASGAEVTIDPQTGGLKVDGEIIQRAKLRIDTRMRMAGKLKPKKYGDKLTQEIDLTTKAAQLTDEQLDAAIAKRASEAGIANLVGREGEKEA